jgi:E3 ubiquitin-protein ligase FANCL
MLRCTVYIFIENVFKWVKLRVIRTTGRSPSNNSRKHHGPWCTAVLKWLYKFIRDKKKMNEDSITLLTSLDPPQCSIDSNDWGILVITGERDGSSAILPIRPIVRSLGVLRRQQETGTHTVVPLFPANPDPLSRNLQRIRGLEDRLTKLVSRKALKQHDNKSASPSDLPPLLLFQQECEGLFREILSALQLRKEPPIDNDQEWVLTSNYVRQLVRELGDLEEHYGGSAIAHVSEDCQRMTLQYQDSAEREHVVDLNLADYDVSVRLRSHFPQTQDPKQAPLLVGPRKRPREIKDRWNLVEAYREFCDTVNSHQALYNELDDMDAHLVILEPDLPCTRNVAFRRIQATAEMSVVLTLSVHNPRKFPDQIQWVGRDPSKWETRFNPSEWNDSRSVRENMDYCLGVPLPRQHAEATDPTPAAECAICYSDELINEGTGMVEYPDVPCDNESCGRLYHQSCLREWLTSLPDSRISFDCILGTCPYCKQPLSASMQNR